jgi:hypothetical protein
MVAESIIMAQKFCNELICSTFAPATEEFANLLKNQLPAEIIGGTYFITILKDRLHK